MVPLLKKSFLSSGRKTLGGSRGGNKFQKRRREKEENMEKGIHRPALSRRGGRFVKHRRHGEKGRRSAMPEKTRGKKCRRGKKRRGAIQKKKKKKEALSTV